jgi:Flp pilus assembly secretin CpaC
MTKIFHHALCIILLLQDTESWAAQRRRTLIVGQIATETLNANEIVKLNRKGLVDIIDVSASEFQLLALRPGILVATIEDEFGTPKRKLIFDISSKQAVSKRDIFSANSEIYQFLCRSQPSVSCSGEQFEVQGLVDDAQWFYKAMALCEKHSPCLFKVLLSKKGRELLKESIGQRAKILGVDIQNNGYIDLRIDCKFWTQKRLGLLLKAYHIEDYFITSQCVNNQRQYHVKIIASTKRQLEARQIKPWLSSKFLPSYIDGTSYIKAQKQQNHRHVISEPEFWLSLHNKSIIRHGLEIRVQSSSEDASQYWRRLGFKLEMSVLEQSKDRLFLDFDLGLSEPEGTGGRVYTAGMQSQVWVELGQIQTLGYLVTTSKNSDKNEHIPLASIPIIGPLFRNKANDQGASRIKVDIIVNAEM